ncbi:hypothetical protein CDAR_600261 [Caerostris darwini]|uniref:Uncharacterized protein n=1 Tax=Caerostris darwini TaxID=1538125 RepID=A0AAV4SX05_9ARAC|nr:hypothetical protein CDAR_600261 [Caerostris darwini]
MNFRAGDIRAIGAPFTHPLLLEMPSKARSGGIPLNGFSPALELDLQIPSKLVGGSVDRLLRTRWRNAQSAERSNEPARIL